MVNFEGNWLLPFPPDLKQKAGSLQQKPCEFSPAVGPPADGVAHQVQAHMHNSCEPINHPVSLQTDQP